MFNIRLFNPAADPVAVANFYTWQSCTYAEFAAEKAATSTTKEELEDGCVYFIVAEDESTGEFVGGLRLYFRLAGMLLPVERVLAGNYKLHQTLNRRSHLGIAEISGLWVQSRWRGTGLSSALVRVAVAAMPLLKAAYGIAFSHHHVLKSWYPIGFVIDHAAGRLPYPDTRYESSVIWIDPLTLRYARPEQQALIFSHRDVLRRSGLIRWNPVDGEQSASPMSEARTNLPL